MPSVCAPRVPHSLSVQQLLELTEVGGHGVPDTWHGDSPEQTARATRASAKCGLVWLVLVR
jgi:hypothetical protein